MFFASEIVKWGGNTKSQPGITQEHNSNPKYGDQKIEIWTKSQNVHAVIKALFFVILNKHQNDNRFLSRECICYVISCNIHTTKTKQALYKINIVYGGRIPLTLCSACDVMIQA